MSMYACLYLCDNTNKWNVKKQQQQSAACWIEARAAMPQIAMGWRWNASYRIGHESYYQLPVDNNEQEQQQQIPYVFDNKQENNQRHNAY